MCILLNSLQKSIQLLKVVFVAAALLFVSQTAAGAKPEKLLAASEGKAFTVEQTSSGIIKTPIKTSSPVFEVFGISQDSRSILYSPLKHGNPSGELYLEDIVSGISHRINVPTVIAASLSPDGSRAAFTYVSGTGFGLGVTDFATGNTQFVRSGDVFPDLIEWERSGSGIKFFVIDRNEQDFKLDSQIVQLVETGKSLTADENSFPVIEQKMGFGFTPLTNRPGRSFVVSSNDGYSQVIGADLAGAGELRILNNLTGEVREVSSGKFLRMSDDGFLTRQFTKSGSKLVFTDWNGLQTELGTITVNFNFPEADSQMIQGGFGYTSPGNCGIISHGPGIMEFAYDFKDPTVNEHIIAAADGLVVYNSSNPDCSGCGGTFFGETVILQHTDGSYTKYAHLESGSPQALNGTDVCQGLYIANQGSTGSANGNAHLHFQRQSSADLFGQSIAVDFSDAGSNPLSCSTNYTSASTELFHSISPSSHNAVITGDSGNSITVTSTGCNWSAVSNKPWITITNPGSGIGNDSVIFSVADNSGGAPRSGSINVAGKTFTVTQDGTAPVNQPPTVNAGTDQTITLPSLANLTGSANDDGLPAPPGALTINWSQISGGGSVVFGNANALTTTADFSLAGIYVLRLTVDDGEFTVSDDIKVIVNVSGGGGSLSGSRNAHPANVNLTTQGTADWAHWGLVDASSFNHKNGVVQQISNVTPIGSTSTLRYANNLNSYNWSDGTPTASNGGTSSGIYMVGVGEGLQISVPASTDVRTLRVYTGVYRARGRLEVTISDGSASPFIDTSLEHTTGSANTVFLLNFQAASSGQTLYIRWVVDAIYDPFGNATLQAAAYQTPSAPVNTAPTADAGTDQTITLPAMAVMNGSASDDGYPIPPGTLTTTWSKISGEGNVTFIDPNDPTTNVSFSSAGIYNLRLTASDGQLIHTDDVRVVVNTNSGGGLLATTFSATPSTVDLTNRGTGDWAHWGHTAVGSFNHKSGVTQKISNYNLIGTNPPNRYTDNPTSYIWSDGTPSAVTGGSTTGIWVGGLGNGFTFTVAADTMPKTLELYVGLWAAGGRLEATLSDGAGSPIIDNSFSSANVANGKFRISFQANSSGQTLTIRWVVDNLVNPFGNITLQAAVLDDTFEGDIATRPYGSRNGSIDLVDLIQLRRFLGGLDMPYQSNEFERADCAPLSSFGDGNVDLVDIIQIRRFMAGLDSTTKTGGLFEFSAPSGFKLEPPPRKALLANALSVQRVSLSGNVVKIEVRYDSGGTEVGVSFSIDWDTAVLSNPTNITLGSGVTGTGLTTNSTQVGSGRLGIALDRNNLSDPFPAGDTQLVTVEFTLVPVPPAPTTTINFGDQPLTRLVVYANTSTLTPMSSSGTIGVLGPSAASVTVGGRVRDLKGRGLSRVLVTMSDQFGATRSAITNTFGYYRFDGVLVGESYFVSAFGKGKQFEPPFHFLTVSDARDDVNFVVVSDRSGR